MEILDQALHAARTFRPMSDDQIRTLLAKTRDAAMNGEFEPFKISTIYDGTAKNTQWLGEDAERFSENNGNTRSSGVSAPIRTVRQVWNKRRYPSFRSP